AHEAALLAVPLPVFRLVFMPTSGTLAACSSFRAREARDVSLLCLVSEIGEVFAIFPEGHALIMMPSVLFVADPMGIANKEGANLLFHTEVHHSPRGLMAQITDTTLRTTTLFVLGALQLLPSPRVFL